ncbi:L-aspartate oxidase [candidate division WOR-1 bacterium RIFCSPHIGHO2_02_FULL_45_12]|nr:MAG: L-aspartate oxidase [candidate division WOR-1 bacterium RIFCSPHIGHO2_02_FULL_45_12]
MYDFLIIGGGIAGLSAALEASKHGKVLLLTKGKIGETATEKAQGGIAAAIDQIRDSTEFHFEDTIAAGAGLCDETAVRILVTEGVERVKELIEMGARFDRAETEAGGGFALALEGAHKRRRILHAGDATGEEIQRTLGSKIIREKLVEIKQHTIGIDLIIKGGKCIGVKALDIKINVIKNFLAKATIITTGGLGQAYLYTTNPKVATGDGIAMAYRAGVRVSDMEFVQFHPTSMVQSQALKDIIALPRFLISEAVRGEGAVLLNIKGERFMQKYDIQGELAPRDIVAKAIFQEMKDTNQAHVFLSLGKLGHEKIKKRFPVIYKTCLERGLDITKDNIPVAPAAHYFMGGIKTDVNGQTNIKNLYAAGECASLGVHGANRLASNSLLDGLVFGRRATLAAKSQLSSSRYSLPITHYSPAKPHLTEKAIVRCKMIIKTTMWKDVGIVRSKKSLGQALKMLKQVNPNQAPANREEIELRNLAQVAKLITQAALDRKESRGAHFRSDFPKKNDKKWQKHLIYKIG